MPNSILSPLSFTSVFDSDTGEVIQADIYFYTGGTTNQIPVYTDAAQTTPHAQPIRTTGNGRFPPIFVGEISAYRIRVYDTDGVLLEDVNDLPGAEPDPADVPDPIATDQTALLATGDIIARFASESSLARTNFVRCNGKHLGPTSIGAGAVAGSELASDDAEDLFLWLWGADNAHPNNRLQLYDTNGSAVAKNTWASAAAAWAAKARIQIPDLRGRTIAGLDAMGSSASARLTSGASWSTGTGVAPGDVGGSVSHQLTAGQLAVHSHANTAASSQAAHQHAVVINDHSHTYTAWSNSASQGGLATGLVNANGSSASVYYGNAVAVNAFTASSGGVSSQVGGYTDVLAPAITTTMTNANAGSGELHNNMQPTMTLMFYMRL